MPQIKKYATANDRLIAHRERRRLAEQEAERGRVEREKVEGFAAAMARVAALDAAIHALEQHDMSNAPCYPEYEQIVEELRGRAQLAASVCFSPAAVRARLRNVSRSGPDPA